MALISLAWIPIAIFCSIFLVFGLTEVMFSGLIISQDNHNINDDTIIGECVIMNRTGTATSICKSEYGLLGWKQWTSDDEEKRVNDVLEHWSKDNPKIIIVPKDFKGTVDLGN